MRSSSCSRDRMAPGRSSSACSSANSRAVSDLAHAVDDHVAGGEVELQRGGADHRMRGAVAAPHDGAHARQQFAQLEGLQQVVVGAEVERLDAVVEPVARGEHQHGRGVAALAGAPQHLGAVLPSAGRGRAARRCSRHRQAHCAPAAPSRTQSTDQPAPSSACIRLRADHFVVFHQQCAHEGSLERGRRRGYAGILRPA